MTALALVAAKSSPGVTTTGVLLAAVWPAPAVLVEADVAGGDLRCWYTDSDGQPLRPDLGLVSLLTAHHPTHLSGPRPQDAAGLAGHAQRLPGGLEVLVGPSSPEQAAVLRGQWPRLTAALSGYDGDVLLDLGRLTGTEPVADPGADVTLSLLRGCAVTLVVCRSSVASVAHTRDLLRRLTEDGIPTEVLAVADPAEQQELRTALGGVAVHVLPENARDAAALTGSWTRRLDRSPLVVAARRAAATLHAHVHDPIHAPEPMTATDGVFTEVAVETGDASAAVGTAMAARS